MNKRACKSSRLLTHWSCRAPWAAGTTLAVSATIDKTDTDARGTVGDASSLFADPAVQLFDLQDDADHTVGRLAVVVTRAPAGASSSSRRLHRIAGDEKELTVEIGRTRMAVRDVLDLEPGRIVELDRSAGAPADIKLNGRIIAHGEVVVVDQDYAVRITRILENVEA